MDDLYLLIANDYHESLRDSATKISLNHIVLRVGHFNLNKYTYSGIYNMYELDNYYFKDKFEYYNKFYEMNMPYYEYDGIMRLQNGIFDLRTYFKNHSYTFEDRYSPRSDFQKDNLSFYGHALGNYINYDSVLVDMASVYESESLNINSTSHYEYVYSFFYEKGILLVLPVGYDYTTNLTKYRVFLLKGVKEFTKCCLKACVEPDNYIKY